MGNAELLSFIGVASSVFGNIIATLGLNFQRRAHLQIQQRVRQEGEMGKRVSFVKHPVWLTGLALNIFGNIFDAVALAFLPQSVAAPLKTATQITSNPLLAKAFNKERLTQLELFATVKVVAGAVLVVAFSDQDEDQDNSVEELKENFIRPVFIVYGIALGGSIVFVTILVKGLQSGIKITQQRPRGRRMSEGAFRQELRQLRILRILVCMLSGMWGSLTVLFAKSGASLIRGTIEGKNAFADYFTYPILVGIVATGAMQIYNTNKGLRKFGAVFVVPVFLVFFTGFSILNGAFYFEEFEEFSFLKAIMFSLGVAFIVWGVHTFSKRKIERTSTLGRTFSIEEVLDEGGLGMNIAHSPSDTNLVRGVKPDVIPGENVEKTAPSSTEEQVEHEDHRHDTPVEEVEEVEVVVVEGEAPPVCSDPSYVTFPTTTPPPIVDVEEGGPVPVLVSSTSEETSTSEEDDAV